MSDGTEMVKKEVEAYVEEKVADARKYVEEKLAEADAKASAYAEAPKPRWYVAAALLCGLLLGVVGTLAIVAFR